VVGVVVVVLLLCIHPAITPTAVWACGPLGWGLWPGVTLSARSDRPWKVGERLVKAFSPTSSATKVKFKMTR